MAETAQADDGAQLPLDSIPMVFAYSGNNITSITVVYQGKTYVQTFSYSGLNVTNISGWEVQ